MDSHALEMTAELAAELASSERRRIDPRSQRLRFHHLKAMGQSALHCRESFQDERSDSLAMRIGSGVHALLLGKPTAVFDQPAKKGKGKAPRNGAAWQEFQERHRGCVILTPKEMKRAGAVSSSIEQHEAARRLLLSDNVIREQTIEWDWLGRACRSTPDARSAYSLVDLKTTRCAEPQRFSWEARQRGYHAQLAFYRLAIESKVGIAPLDCHLVAVESLPPYAVTVFRLTSRAIERGEALCRGWMERFLVCEAANQWPSYADEPVEMDVPDDDLDLVFDDDGDATEEPAANDS
jgi:hypothetical protein